MTPNGRSIFHWFYGVFSKKSRSNKRCPANYSDYLLKNTFFTETQIEELYERFCQFASTPTSNKLPKYITKSDFFLTHSFTNYPFYSLMFDLMFGSNKDKITFLDMCKYLSLFEKNNLNIEVEKKLILKKCKLQFLFKLLDINGDSIIDRKEMTEIVIKLSNRPFDEQTFVLNIVDSLIETMNLEKLEKIDFDNFYKILENINMEECMLLF